MHRYLLLFLIVSVAFCRGPEQREAPPGFHSQRYGPLGGEIFVPDGWKYREPGGPKGSTYIIAKEFAPDGSYDTGMRIQFIPDVKKSNGFTPKEAVDVNVNLRKRGAQVLSECPPQQYGLFTRICLETIAHPVASKPKQAYHVITAFWWSDQLDLIVGVTFGAPVEEWEAAKFVYEISGNIKVYDDDWVRAHGHHKPTSAAPADEKAAASMNAGPAAPTTAPSRDTSLDAVVKLNALQFVNRLDDLQWRIGTSPDALVARVEAMRRVIADHLKSAQCKKPAVADAMIGIAPKGRWRVWLVNWDGVLAPEQQQALVRKLESVPPLEVRNGPLALNLTLELNGAKAGKADPSKMRLPDEWLAALNGRSVVLPDGLPESIWTADPK